jgi:SAM-dependent methyltransferase
MIVKTKPGPKRLLHVGCGPRHRQLPAPFLTDEWTEVRLDLDPGVKPDVLASIISMPAVPDASVDAVYSSHNIEHVYAHEVPLALAEFHRVLKPGGFVMILTPNLQGVAEAVAKGNLEGTLFVSSAGPIAALDILYGHRASIAAGNHFMSHKTGFTAETLGAKLKQVGFVDGEVQVAPHDLFAIAYKR